MMSDPIFLNIHIYGIMIAIGVLCAFVTLFAVAKKSLSPILLILLFAGLGMVLYSI